MYSKKQVKAIIDTLKDTSIEGRPALQQVFEQGGYMWATNGYIALELGEVRDEYKGKRITLQALVGWYGTHKTKDTTALTELLEDNPETEPDMTLLLHKEFAECKEPRFDIDLMKTACNFLGVSQITLEETASNGSKCYRIKPLEDMHISNEAMDIKAYVMSLIK